MLLIQNVKDAKLSVIKDNEGSWKLKEKKIPTGFSHRCSILWKAFVSSWL